MIRTRCRKFRAYPTGTCGNTLPCFLVDLVRLDLGQGMNADTAASVRRIIAKQFGMELDRVVGDANLRHLVARQGPTRSSNFLKIQGSATQGGGPRDRRLMDHDRLVARISHHKRCRISQPMPDLLTAHSQPCRKRSKIAKFDGIWRGPIAYGTW